MTVTLEVRLAKFEPMVRRVARKVAKDYPHLFEIEDLEQELRMFVVKRGDDLPLPGESGWSPNTLLLQEARGWAFNQKRQVFLIDSNFSYETADVKRILETHFDAELWDAVAEGESVEDKIAAHSDIAWALNRMRQKDQDFIRECYAAKRLPKSGTAEYRQLRDCLVKLTNMCNHYTRSDEGNGPGRRVVVSNATSRAFIDMGEFN